MNAQLWIEPVGNIIIARVRGRPTQEILVECQDRILNLVKDTQRGLILHDCLEMDTPQVEVPMSQWKIDQESADVQLKRAVVVPNTTLAYLARLAFGEGDVRVFYNDMAAAFAWLTDKGDASHVPPPPPSRRLSAITRP